MKDLITELQDLRYLDWTDEKMSPGTPGCFLKAYEEKDGNDLGKVETLCTNLQSGIRDVERKM